MRFSREMKVIIYYKLLNCPLKVCACCQANQYILYLCAAIQVIKICKMYENELNKTAAEGYSIKGRHAITSKKKAIISNVDAQIMRRLMRFSGRVKEILPLSSLCYLQISLAGQTHFVLLALKNTILPLFFSETVIPPTVGRTFCTPSSFF